MINIIIVCIALAISFFIGVYALFRSQSNKKNYFLLLQTTIIVYLLGYLLALTSTNAEEAFGGVKVLFIGSFLAAIFAFFFVADYCGIKVHPVFVKLPMLLAALAGVILIWTTNYHQLVFAGYYFTGSAAFQLRFTRGSLFYPIHVYPAICMIPTIGALLWQMNNEKKKNGKKKYWKQLRFIMLCTVIPFAAELIYLFTAMSGRNTSGWYLTPHSFSIMSLCLYLGLMRHNIQEIIPAATLTTMDHIGEGFVLVDQDNNYLSSNSTTLEIFPEITKIAKGESIFTAKNWPAEPRDMESGTTDFSINDDRVRYFRASISPVFGENEALTAKIILFWEITDSVNLMKELENAAYIDSLTGIYNRKHFSELANVDIERSLRMDQSIYAAMLDLDFFKNVNDTYGHATGDIILKATAGVIRQTIRSYDLLGRYGGEEFVLLITNLDSTEAYNLMERIRENMEHSITNCDGVEITVTCSIGLAKYLENDSLEEVVKKADAALYAAKRSGRNQVKIYDDLLKG